MSCPSVHESRLMNGKRKGSYVSDSFQCFAVSGLGQVVDALVVRKFMKASIALSILEGQFPFPFSIGHNLDDHIIWGSMSAPPTEDSKQNCNTGRSDPR